jgi:hypothetical protein
MAFETGGEADAQFILDTVDETGQQSGGGQPLPLGQTGLIGQQKVRRGDGKALPCRGQQQARSVALVPRTVNSGFGHGLS